MYDLEIGCPAMTPESTYGEWRLWPATRVQPPMLRCEGTPEEIAVELQRLRETCPWKPSYEAPEKIEDPYCTVHIYHGRWFAPEHDDGRYVLWLSIAVVQCDEPRQIPPFKEWTAEYFAERMKIVGKTPMAIESDELKRLAGVRLERSESPRTDPAAPPERP